MKTWIQMLIYAAIGFISVIVAIKTIRFDLTPYTNAIVIGILLIVLILLVSSLVLSRQIKLLNGKDVYGEEEDEVEAFMYKKFADYSFLVSTSMNLSVLALCISVITIQNLFLSVMALAAIIISYALTLFMARIAKWVYPERNLPSISEKNYSEKILEASDEGERHILLIGLYKTHNFISIALIVGIILATFYSVLSEHSQIFSIVVMSMVLIIAQGKYLFSIRNK